jgi:hypothetical protein
MIKKHFWCFGYLNLERDQVLSYGSCLFGANMSIHVKKDKKEWYFDERLGRQLENKKMIFAEDFELCSRYILSKHKVMYIHDIIVINNIEEKRLGHTHIFNRYVNLAVEDFLVTKILQQKFEKLIIPTYFSELSNVLNPKHLLYKLRRFQIKAMWDINFYEFIRFMSALKVFFLSFKKYV